MILMITAKEAKNITEARRIEIIKEKLESNKKLLEDIENRIKTAASIDGWNTIYFYFAEKYYSTISDMVFIENYLADYCGFKTKLFKDKRNAWYLEISWR